MLVVFGENSLCARVLFFVTIEGAAVFQWRELGKDEKIRYEEKAKKLAEENAAKQAEAEKAFNESLSMFPPSGEYFSRAVRDKRREQRRLIFLEMFPLL